MKKLPAALVTLRAICGPALLACAAGGVAGRVLAGLVTVAFLSDVFDGIIARRLGAATESLRRADTIADTAFYVCATAALLLRAPSVLRAHALGIGTIISLEILRWVVERARYGRLAAYHMWSAKLWGVTVWLGFSEAFLTAQPGPLIQMAVIIGLIADTEGLITSLILSRWRHDVPSLWHAVRIEREFRASIDERDEPGESSAGG